MNIKGPRTDQSFHRMKYIWILPSVLWHCWLGGRKGIRPVKNLSSEVLLVDRVADLHMAQLMPLPLTSLAPVKSRLVLPFWYRLTWVVPDKGPLNGCVCEVYMDFSDFVIYFYRVAYTTTVGPNHNHRMLRIKCNFFSLYVHLVYRLDSTITSVVKDIAMICLDVFEMIATCIA